MKAPERTRISKTLRGVVPGLVEKGRMLLFTPRGRILRGFYLEDASATDACYLWVFVQPLYVPADSVVLNLGKRLGGGARTWKSRGEDDALIAAAKNEGLSFVAGLASARDLADWEALRGQTDPYAQETLACSLIAAGRFADGIRALERLEQAMAGGAFWMQEVGARAAQLRRLVEADPARAIEQLARWEMETATHLGVQDIE